MSQAPSAIFCPFCSARLVALPGCKFCQPCGLYFKASPESTMFISSRLLTAAWSRGLNRGLVMGFGIGMLILAGLLIVLSTLQREACIDLVPEAPITAPTRLEA